MHTVEAYLNVRRAAGFRLRSAEALLRSYARFASQRGEDYVRTQTALDWARLTSSPQQRGRRLEAVRIFARYAQAEDARHELPPAGLFGVCRPAPIAPFIFSPEQLHQLLERAANLPPVGSLRPWTYCTLLSLLAVTGLRISEALALRFDDLTPDGLLIRETKFRKSRLLPLHPSTAAGLERYLVRRRQRGGDNDYVFISHYRRPLAYPTVAEVFRGLIRELGLASGPGQHRPRLHDLRHTWAVRTLLACPTGYTQVNQQLLAMSTYLGHTGVTGTFRYLHTTPELLADIAASCEHLIAERGLQP